MRGWVKRYGLLIGWGAMLGVMIANSHGASTQPHQVGVFGREYSAGLWQVALASAIELAVLYLVLRPWSYHASWRRSLWGLVMFVPWLGYLLLVSVHLDGILALHILWVALIVGLLLVLFGTGLLSALIGAAWKRLR